jgi:PAS domain S-box-containing protein
VKNFFRRLNAWLEVPSSDPDDARRRKLLNIVMSGISVLSSILMIVLIALFFTKPHDWWRTEAESIFWATLGLLVGCGMLFYLNRKLKGWWTSGLFLIFMTVAISFVDNPTELVEGRSLFLFVLPIVIASVLMPAWAIWVATALSLAVLTVMAYQLGPNSLLALPTSYVAFAFISLLCWLSARAVENTLRDLRKLNRELDQRVIERTQELADSLTRERAEAGRIKAILESIADGVIVFDLQGKAVISNPSSERLLETPIEQIVGSSMEELSHSNALAIESREILGKLLQSPTGQAASRHILWGKRTLSATSAQVNDTQGAHIGTVAVFRDYTPEAQVEAMKNTFLAIVSHELRTPLNAILGYAEMIKEAIYGPVNEKQVRASDRIMANSHRLLDIVSDLLDQAQMEAGKLALHVRSFRPVDLLDNIHGVMDKIAADKGLALTSELDPDMPELIKGDIARLQQILVNLINNAIKFTEEGSVSVNLKRSGRSHWALVVTDSGIGIPESELPTIFEAFRQVDSTATRKYGGFGLGLSIVKQLTELMGGNVTVTSKMGVGTIFTATLPLKQVKRSGNQ